MPTFSRTDRFVQDLKKLTAEQRQRFHSTVIGEFVADLRRVQATAGVWEMTWAPNGRATFEYGPEQRPGERHVTWRRVGTHEIFNRP